MFDIFQDLNSLKQQYGDRIILDSYLADDPLTRLSQIPQTFVNSLSHGTTVSKIILDGAPQVKVIPINAIGFLRDGTKIKYLREEYPNVHILNLSMVFPSKNDTSGTQQIDEEFLTELTKWEKGGGILIEALGNSSKECSGGANSLYKRHGIPESPYSQDYGDELTKNIYQRDAWCYLNTLHVVMTSADGKNLNEMSTTPGSIKELQEHTVAAPGFTDPKNVRITAGSSFAAPRVTALAARLLGIIQDRFGSNLKPEEQTQYVVRAIKEGAHIPPNLTKEDVGYGVVDGPNSYQYLHTVLEDLENIHEKNMWPQFGSRELQEMKETMDKIKSLEKSKKRKKQKEGIIDKVKAKINRK